MKNNSSTQGATLRTPNLARRRFIVGSAAAGGGLALGLTLPLGTRAATAAKPRRAAKSTRGC